MYRRTPRNKLTESSFNRSTHTQCSMCSQFEFFSILISVREYSSIDYKIWNSHGDAPSSFVPPPELLSQLHSSNGHLQPNCQQCTVSSTFPADIYSPQLLPELFGQLHISNGHLQPTIAVRTIRSAPHFQQTFIAHNYQLCTVSSTFPMDIYSPQLLPELLSQLHISNGHLQPTIAVRTTLSTPLFQRTFIAHNCWQCTIVHVYSNLPDYRDQSQNHNSQTFPGWTKPCLHHHRTIIDGFRLVRADSIRESQLHPVFCQKICIVCLNL